MATTRLILQSSLREARSPVYIDASLIRGGPQPGATGNDLDEAFLAFDLPQLVREDDPRQAVLVIQDDENPNERVADLRYRVSPGSSWPVPEGCAVIGWRGDYSRAAPTVQRFFRFEHTGTTALDTGQVEPSASLAPIFNRLAHFRRLGPDWDGGGSPPPTSIAVEEARRLMILAETRWLSSVGARALPYHVAPMSGGGVQIEYRGLSSDLEIDIASDGQCGFLLVEKGPHDEEIYKTRDNATRQEVLEAVASVVR